MMAKHKHPKEDRSGIYHEYKEKGGIKSRFFWYCAGGDVSKPMELPRPYYYDVRCEPMMRDSDCALLVYIHVTGEYIRKTITFVGVLDRRSNPNQGYPYIWNVSHPELKCYRIYPVFADAMIDAVWDLDAALYQAVRDAGRMDVRVFEYIEEHVDLLGLSLINDPGAGNPCFAEDVS